MKLNYKKYLLISFAITLLSCLITRRIDDSFYIFLVFGATLINHYFLLKIVTEMVINGGNSGEKKSKIVVSFIVKVAVLVLALYFSVQHMGSRVIIPLINYVIQIFVMTVCLEKKEE